MSIFIYDDSEEDGDVYFRSGNENYDNGDDDDED